MKHAIFALILISAAGLVAQEPEAVVGKRPAEFFSHYELGDIEAYLESSKSEYIRPGFNLALEDLQISQDGHVTVTLRMTDDLGQPLDRAGLKTPGSISISFVLAAYDGLTRNYTAYTARVSTSPINGNSAVQATSDSGGSWQDLEQGLATYTLGTTIPADANYSATHTLAIYATRNTSDIVGKSYYANLVQDFRPDGGLVEETWDAMSTATCNNCHDPLALHGGSRQEVKLCVTCHSPQSSDPDTGNTVDMGVMVHKIHMGHNLPSVQAGIPYQIIGFRQSVHDYSTVAMPQDLRNCTTCHADDASEGHIWLTNPSRDACGSCHDNIDWVSGEGHRAGPAEDDSRCAECHTPQGEEEFDISIMGAHTIPTKSQQLAGLNMEILSAENTGPGQTPTVHFTLTNNDGSSVMPSDLNSLALLLGGPNSDIAEYYREDARSADYADGVASYTFSTAIPEDATGSWSISADAYRNVDIAAGDETISVREAAFNPLLNVAVTDDFAQPRREIVDVNKCNVCHDSLALHGGQRFRIEECVVCHNANGDDSPVRPPDTGTPESIHFKFMVHRIHKGEELERDYTIYGFRSSVHNYNEVLYPGDLRNCEACHLAGTYSLPTPEGALATMTPNDWYTPMQPAAAACLSCHDSVDAAAHAYVNTAPFGEACGACHGPNREVSVEKVHAR